MKSSHIASTVALATLPMAGCAAQSTTQAEPPVVHNTLASRSVELPASVGAGQPREVRVLVDEPALKMATITLRQGTALPEHRAPVPVTIQALQGEGIVVSGDLRLQIDATHMVVLAPNAPHAVEPKAGTDMLLLVHHLRRESK